MAAKVSFCSSLDILDMAKPLLLTAAIHVSGSSTEAQDSERCVVKVISPLFRLVSDD